MQPKEVFCKTCKSSFLITNPRSRQVYCSHECRKPRENTLEVNECCVCKKQFKPTYSKMKYCSDDCRQTGFSVTRKRDPYVKNCLTCKNEFQTHKKHKQYCSQKCYGARFGKVKKNCVICQNEFEVAYRFRGTLTCGRECLGKRLSEQFRERFELCCLNCNCKFEVVRNALESAKYCSTKCFYEHKYNRVSSILVKECEACNEEFVVKFIRRNKRFCSKKCAVSGERNGMFGKPGTMLGKPAWSRGLTAKTDERLKALGEKISITLKEGFASGRLSHVGENNPNFGYTKDVISAEKRANFSRAAIERILRGVAGYKTGHLSGYYDGKFGRVRFKSSWELAAMMYWDACDDVLMYTYEPTVLVLADGRHALPNFYIVFRDEKLSGFYEIKPTPIQELDEVKTKLDLVRSALAEKNFQYFLLGNKEIDKMKKELGDAFTNAVHEYKNRS